MGAPQSSRVPSSTSSEAPRAFRSNELRAVLRALREEALLHDSRRDNRRDRPQGSWRESPRMEAEPFALTDVPASLEAATLEAASRKAAWEDAAQEDLGPPSSNGPPAMRPHDLAAVLAKLI